MAYALVGIPLGLVMFQSIGERLNNFSSFVIRNVKRMLKYDNIEASETNLILVVTALTTITISGLFHFLSQRRAGAWNISFDLQVEPQPFPNTKAGRISIPSITVSLH